MKNLMLRGCDEELARALKTASRRHGLSVNRLIIEILRKELVGEGKNRQRHDDLDRLAGTWSDEDAASFERSTAGFEELDDSLWVAETPGHRS